MIHIFVIDNDINFGGHIIGDIVINDQPQKTIQKRQRWKRDRAKTSTFQPMNGGRIDSDGFFRTNLDGKACQG
uniref:Uncharacterized protein n=1 Tax=Romanomermis culicivorax TaxID=13658 RepID=A0A915L670_ROMCU